MVILVGNALRSEARARADWTAALTDWLKPFVEKLGHKKRPEIARCLSPP